MSDNYEMQIGDLKDAMAELERENERLNRNNAIVEDAFLTNERLAKENKKLTELLELAIDEITIYGVHDSARLKYIKQELLNK